MPCNIVAGVDLSYNPPARGLEHVSVVIGTNEAVASVLKDCGRNDIHMVMIRPRKTRKNIISALNIRNRDMLAFCIKRDISIVDKMHKMQRIRRRNLSKSRIFKYVHYKTFVAMQPRITDYLAAHGCSLSDIAFQCDMDCAMFLKQNGLRSSQRGGAYVISDIVAWANSHGLAPDGVVEIDMTKTLRDEVLSSI